MGPGDIVFPGNWLTFQTRVCACVRATVTYYTVLNRSRVGAGLDLKKSFFFFERR